MRLKLSILLVSLAAVFYLGAGTYKASHFSADYIPLYSGMRCFVRGCNPYVPAELQAELQRDGGKPARMSEDYWTHRPLLLVYPPSTLLVLALFTLVLFAHSAVLWALLGGGLLITAVGMILWVCPRKYFEVAVVLATIFLLADSPSLLGTGNPATFACALALIGTVLYLRDRYIPLATVLFIVSLTVKPQIAGIIMLYFLARRIHWRGAAIVLGTSLAVLLIACGILQARPGSRDWLPALRASIAAQTQPGQVDDPTPANLEFGDMVNLQTITSVFIGNSTGYNAAAWVIWLGLLAWWIYALRDAVAGGADHWLALPPLLVLSLLPMYHRGCDDLLLMLAIPMVVRVMGTHRRLGMVMAVATALPHLMDVVMPRVLQLVREHGSMPAIVQHKLLFIAVMRYQCPVLLLLFGLYVAGMYSGRTVKGSQETALGREAFSA